MTNTHVPTLVLALGISSFAQASIVPSPFAPEFKTRTVSLTTDRTSESDPIRLAAAHLEGEKAAAIVAAGQALDAALGDEQTANLYFAFDNAEQRANWSNLPTSMVSRAGVRMGDLNDEQEAAVWTFLGTILSKDGLEKIQGIVAGDEYLQQQGGGGGRPTFGEDEFYLSILGQISKTEPWIVQFGGHHLGINVFIKGDEGVLTPTLTCTQPARFTLDGKDYEPMAGEINQALKVAQSLSNAQRDDAVLGSEFRDMILGPGQDGRTLAPEGVQVSTFSADQKALLMDLISEWAGIVHKSAATKKMKEIENNLNETWFAWSGPIEEGEPAYFRIQGPTLHIELAPQNLGGDPTQHIHSIYRDPTNDYGVKSW